MGDTAALSLEEDPGACQGTLMTNALANIYRSRAGPRGGTRKSGMSVTRRCLLLGEGLALLAPRPLRAQSDLERLHQARIDVPILAEDATAVPVRVSVDHPMEPDHHINSLDDQPISEFQMTSAVSANPVIRFPLRAARSGALRVVFVNRERRRWEVALPLRI